MPVEIAIQVVNRMDGGKASMNRVYFLEDLLTLPQAHIKIWNDIVMMSEDVQKPPPNDNPLITHSPPIG